MAQVCINEDCQDEDGPFARTAEGWLCEDCAESQNRDCE